MRTKRKETKRLYEIPVTYDCKVLRKHKATFEGTITVKTTPSEIEKVWEDISDKIIQDYDSQTYIFSKYKALKA